MAINLDNGRHWIGVRDGDSITVEDETYDVIAEQEEYFALFQRGRSVYLAGVGSEYRPARIYFCHRSIHNNKNTEPNYYFTVILDCPIRRS